MNKILLYAHAIKCEQRTRHQRIWYFENNAESKPVYWKTLNFKLFVSVFIFDFKIYVKRRGVYFKKLWSKNNDHVPRDELLSTRLFNNQFIFKIKWNKGLLAVWISVSYSSQYLINKIYFYLRTVGLKYWKYA